jgi:hypothetical protein
LLDFIRHPAERAEDAGLEEPVKGLAGLATGPKARMPKLGGEQNREELSVGEILSSDLVKK